MLSREQLINFADELPPVTLPRFRLTPEQSSAFDAALPALERIRRKGADLAAEQEPGASLTEQVAAAKARRAALAPEVDDAMAAQEALAATGLELSVRGAEELRTIVVLRRRTTAPPVAFEREPVE